MSADKCEHGNGPGGRCWQCMEPPDARTPVVPLAPVTARRMPGDESCAACVDSPTGYCPAHTA